MSGNTDRKPKPETAEWELRLYVAGQTQKCVVAFANLQRICEKHLEGHYRTLVDLDGRPLGGGNQ